MDDTGRRHNADENLDDIPLPPPATDQPARMGDWTMQPIDDGRWRHEQLRHFYHDGYDGYNVRDAPWIPTESTSNPRSGQENLDQRLYDNFSEDIMTITHEDRYQSAQDLQRLYPQLDTNVDSGRGGQSGTAADEEFRYWAANSPIARNLQRVMSDGNFEQPQNPSADHGTHWNGAFPTSPLGQPRTEQINQNVPQQYAGNHTAQNQTNPAENVRFEPERRQAHATQPDTSREMLSKLDSILGVVQNLQARVNQLENTDRQTAASEVPQHLQPRRVDPVHRQRLQNVLRDALPKRVQIQEPSSGASAPPLTASEQSVDQTSSPQGSDHRLDGDPQRSHRSERIHYGDFPSRVHRDSERTPDAYQRQQMERSPTDNGRCDRPNAGNNGDYDIRRTLRNDSPPSGNAATRDTRMRSDYTRGPLVGITSTSENKLTELLLRGTVSSQIQNLSGLQGVSSTKDWFRQFEGLTDGWTDVQRMNLLGLKAVQSARLSFEAYENEAITPLYWEAKRAILEAVSAEDSRPINAWNDLKYLQQKPAQSVADFGRHVKYTVSKALGDSLSGAQQEVFCKNYFIDGLRDLGIRRALAGQQERARYTDLVREGALIERSCPTEMPPREPAGNPNHQSAIARDGTYRQNNYGSRPNNYNAPTTYGAGNNKPAYTRTYQNQNQTQRQTYQGNSFGPPRGSFNQSNAQTSGYQKPQASTWTQKPNWQGNNYQNQQESNSGQQPQFPPFRPAGNGQYGTRPTVIRAVEEENVMPQQDINVVQYLHTPCILSSPTTAPLPTILSETPKESVDIPETVQASDNGENPSVLVTQAEGSLSQFEHLRRCADDPLEEARYVFNKLSCATREGNEIKLPSEVANDPLLRGLVLERNPLSSDFPDNVPATAESPSVTLSILGKTGHAVLDTGAECNLLSVRFLFELLKSAFINPLSAGYDPSPPKVKGVNGQLVRLFGTITLPVSIAGQEPVWIKFNVMQDAIRDDILIGTPGLNVLGYRLQNGITGETIAFKSKVQDAPKMSRFLRACRSTVVPPLSSQEVDCYVTGFDWLDKPLLVESLCESAMDNHDDLDYDESPHVAPAPSKVPNEKPSMAEVHMDTGLQSTSNGQKNADKIWTINDKTKTAFELMAECSIEQDDHQNCHMSTVAELDPSVDTSSNFGQMFIITPLQEALLHMLMRETGVTNAERIMSEVIQAGAGNEIVAYLGARGDIVKASIAPSEADMSKAVANRYDYCQVAKRSMKASGHRRVDFSTEMHAFVGQTEQKPWKQLYATTEGIIETTRALLVHRASKLVSKKIVIVGDSTAAQLADELTEKEVITSSKMPDLIRMLTSTELTSGVQNVLIVVGRDAMLADEKVETFEGQCQKLLGYLKGFPNVKVTWLMPPFVDAKKDVYEEWLESIATVLKDTDVDLVWSTRYRSVLEITRYGNKADAHSVDNTGALTGMGRGRMLEYLIAVHRFPISGMRKDKKDKEYRKRDSAHSDRFNGHAGQSFYGKRRRF